MVDVKLLKKSLKHWNNQTLISRYKGHSYNMESKKYMRIEIDDRILKGTLKRKSK